LTAALGRRRAPLPAACLQDIEVPLGVEPVGDAAHHKDPLAARGISDALLGAQLLADHVLRGWDNDLDQALHLYAAELTGTPQRAAYLNDELAGLDLPAEQARRTWLALQAAERQIYSATSSSAASVVASEAPTRW